jgi:hypothetical protein
MHRSHLRRSQDGTSERSCDRLGSLVRGQTIAMPWAGTGERCPPCPASRDGHLVEQARRRQRRRGQEGFGTHDRRSRRHPRTGCGSCGGRALGSGRALPGSVGLERTIVAERITVRVSGLDAFARVTTPTLVQRRMSELLRVAHSLASASTGGLRSDFGHAATASRIGGPPHAGACRTRRDPRGGRRGREGVSSSGANGSQGHDGTGPTPTGVYRCSSERGSPGGRWSGEGERARSSSRLGVRRRRLRRRTRVAARFPSGPRSSPRGRVRRWSSFDRSTCTCRRW